MTCATRVARPPRRRVAGDPCGDGGPPACGRRAVRGCRGANAERGEEADENKAAGHLPRSSSAGSPSRTEARRPWTNGSRREVPGGRTRRGRAECEGCPPREGEGVDAAQSAPRREADVAAAAR